MVDIYDGGGRENRLSAMVGWTASWSRIFMIRTHAGASAGAQMGTCLSPILA